jgi:hypothetical protein
MARDWESTFQSWSRGPGKTEQERCENAERQVKEALAASPALRGRKIRVFTQGSYRNRVNVRQDSDVDIGIVCFDAIFPEFPDDNVKRQLYAEGHLTHGEYTYARFKNEIEAALVARFGRRAVERGSKAFDVHENSYRVDADVAPFFEYRRYRSADPNDFIPGVEMIPDNGKPERIRNWPEQHYQNGVTKNERTAKRFKRMVRVLKKLRNEMAENGIPQATPIPSFLVECLVWNVPESCLSPEYYTWAVRMVLGEILLRTMDASTCREWGEVSELKYLFNRSQPWTHQQVNEFAGEAFSYIGYK